VSDMRTPHRVRTAMTTPEVLVALIVLMLGLQGLLAMQLATVRATGRSESQRRVALHAASLMDSLASIGCLASTGSTTTAGGVLSWRSVVTPGAQTIEVQVTPRAASSWHLERIVPC
jgi:Tfp pilus assembly protein PilV